MNIIGTGNRSSQEIRINTGDSSGGKSFAVLGVAGYVAEKHLQAIKATGNNLVVAVDPHDSVGLLDQYFPEASFFKEIERFVTFLDRKRSEFNSQPIDYVSICTPNYLHDDHIRIALRSGAIPICEKPLVIHPWNLEELLKLETIFATRVLTVLQLRCHPSVKKLKAAMSQAPSAKKDVSLTYVTRRGKWYHQSWKGDPTKSGGLAMNLGIHFFDLLLWIFGDCLNSAVHLRTKSRMAGTLELESARVKWYLSVEEEDLPAQTRMQGGYAHRRLVVDDEEIDLSAGFMNLHTEVYQEILNGHGYGITDARPSIELVHELASCELGRQSDSIDHPSRRAG